MWPGTGEKKTFSAFWVSASSYLLNSGSLRRKHRDRPLHTVLARATWARLVGVRGAALRIHAFARRRRWRRGGRALGGPALACGSRRQGVRAGAGKAAQRLLGPGRDLGAPLVGRPPRQHGRSSGHQGEEEPEGFFFAAAHGTGEVNRADRRMDLQGGGGGPACPSPHPRWAPSRPVSSNMPALSLPNTARSLSSARMVRLSFGSCRLWALM